MSKNESHNIIVLLILMCDFQYITIVPKYIQIEHETKR